MTGEFPRRTRRNVALFSIVALASGWLGLALDAALGEGARNSPGSQGSLGMAVWLILPALTGLLLRAFAGDGWRDAGLRFAWRDSLRWYAFGLLAYPATIALVLAVGRLSGVVKFPATSDAATFIGLVGAAFAASLLKNVFEELAWRSYLTPRLAALGLRPVLLYSLVGLVWGAWHLPYWLFFLDRAVLAASSSLSPASYILFGIVALIVAAAAYGELRWLAGSIWPGVLLHTMGNALIAALLIHRFVAFRSTAAAVTFTPGMEGLAMLALWSMLAALLYRRRTRILGLEYKAAKVAK